MDDQFLEGYNKAIRDVIDILNARRAEEEFLHDYSVYIIDREIDSILDEVIKLQK